MADKIYKSVVRCSLLDAAVAYYTEQDVDFYVTIEDGVVYHNTPEQIKTPVSDSDMTAINAKHQQLIADHDALAYARAREDAYPSMEEQLDMQYKDAINGTTTWADAIAQVKADNPKPSE